MANLNFRKITRLLQEVNEQEDLLAKAKDPSLNHDQLMDIYDKANEVTSEHHQIRSEIAKNPSINVVDFMHKGFSQDHAKSLNENPILPLMDLENPNWVDNLTDSTERIHHYIQHDPEGWFKRISNSSNEPLKEKLFKNISDPQHIQHVINTFNFDHDDYDYSTEPDNTYSKNTLASFNNNLTKEHLDKLLTHPSDHILAAVLHRSSFPPNYIENKWPELEEYKQDILATSKTLPTNVLNHILQHGTDGMKRKVMQNYRLGNKQIDILFNHPDSSSIYDYFENFSNDAELPPKYALHKALEHPDERIGHEIAYYHQLPKEILEKAHTHPSAQVRKAFIDNLNFPLKHLTAFANDPDPKVRAVYDTRKKLNLGLGE